MTKSRYVHWLVAAAMAAACSESKNTEPDVHRRPQDPVAPFPYESADVTFPNADAGITLAATLTWPRGTGPFKAVVLISGTGRNDRNEELRNHRPFLVLSDALTRAGIATLRYDKRGVAASTGDFVAATSVEFAADARAAVGFLRAQRRFSVASVGLVGHSEGGMLAPMAADGNADVAFLVLLAAPGIPGDDLLVSQSRAIGAADGVSQSELDDGEAIDRQLFGTFRQTNDPAALDQMLRAVLTSLGVTGAELEENVAALNTPWMRFFATYDPIPVLRRTRVPVLALNGSLDRQIPADLNLPPIRQALQEAGNSHATVEEVEGLNHLFQTAGSGSPDEYGSIMETMAPAVLSRVSAWIGAGP